MSKLACEIARILLDPFPAVQLTGLERETMRLAARGLTLGQIADQMNGRSIGSTAQLLRIGMEKTGFRHKHELTQYLIEQIEEAIKKGTQ